jgi:hypothetical protein
MLTIWVVCVTVSVLLLVLGAISCFHKKNSSLWLVRLLLLLFAATFAAYLPFSLSEYGLPAALIGNFVNVFHIIVIDSDFMQIYPILISNINNEICVNLYVTLLGILNVSMPAVSALTAVSVFQYYISYIRLSFANKHHKKLFVFSEFNARSFELAKSLKDMNCDIVFAIVTIICHLMMIIKDLFFHRKILHN